MQVQVCTNDEQIAGLMPCGKGSECTSCVNDSCFWALGCIVREWNEQAQICREVKETNYSMITIII